MLNNKNVSGKKFIHRPETCSIIIRMTCFKRKHSHVRFVYIWFKYLTVFNDNRRKLTQISPMSKRLLAAKLFHQKRVVTLPSWGGGSFIFLFELAEESRCVSSIFYRKFFFLSFFLSFFFVLLFFNIIFTTFACSGILVMIAQN